MVLLTALAGGSKVGAQVIRQFPYRVGRSASADWRLEAPGVWDQHFEVDFVPGDGFVLSTGKEALTLVNGTRVDRAVLRNGDCIECGALRLLFALSPVEQRGLKLREQLTWLGVLLLTLAEGFLCWWLMR